VFTVQNTREFVLYFTSEVVEWIVIKVDVRWSIPIRECVNTGTAISPMEHSFTPPRHARAVVLGQFDLHREAWPESVFTSHCLSLKQLLRARNLF